jgi:chromosome segregation ATPase
MSLTEEDLSQVRDVVVSAIQELVLPRFDEYDKRFDAIEQDIRELKEDMRVLKQDVAELKEDVRILKTDMREVKDHLGRLDGRIEALEADVKELYAMIKAQKPTDSDSKFARLSAEQKVLRMYENLKLLAQELGVTLPN